MSRDLTISRRAGALIVRGHEVLLVRDDAMTYLYTVGGRIEPNETSAAAVLREVYEETGRHLEIDRLAVVSHICFASIDLVDKGIDIEEYCDYYCMRVGDDFEPKSYEFSDHGRVLELCWVDLDSDILTHPRGLLHILRDIDSETLYIEDDERVLERI